MKEELDDLDRDVSQALQVKVELADVASANAAVEDGRAALEAAGGDSQGWQLWSDVALRTYARGYVIDLDSDEDGVQQDDQTTAEPMV